VPANRFLPFFAAALTAFSICFAYSEDWPSGAAGDLAFETSSFMKESAYRKPDRASSDFSDSGAYGTVNRAWDKSHSGQWFIEEQRYGFDAVGAGLAWGRKDIIERGLKIFDWGFAQQQADGSFHCPDAFHSTSFFIEATARTALLLQASPYAKDFAPWVALVKPKLLAAAQWMTRPDVEVKGRKSNNPYTHRRYLVAAAFGFTGVLTNDAAMIDKSKEYAREGISLQDPAGFNPEKKGYDSSYHGVGLSFAIRYYTIVADAEMRHELEPMINKGLAWLGTRIKPDGSVDSTGNTRTGLGQEVGRNLKTKTMSYGSAYRAYAEWGMITGDKALEETAEKLASYDRSKPRPSK
jgi:hypothetical protein